MQFQTSVAWSASAVDAHLSCMSYMHLSTAKTRLFEGLDSAREVQRIASGFSLILHRELFSIRVLRYLQKFFAYFHK